MMSNRLLPKVSGISLIYKRFYQIPNRTRNVIPIYPPVENKSVKPDTLLQRISKEELDTQLDPQGWRRALIKKNTPQSIESGDVVRVIYDQSKCSYDPFIGYVLSIDRKHLIQDASILLRNQISKTMVEMRIPIFSPLVERIDILKKNDGKRRRNKHYYIRDTRLDVGNLEAKLRKRK